MRQGSDASEAATKFVECMSSTPNQIAVAERLGLLPTRRSAYDSPAVTGNRMVAAFKPMVDSAHSRAWIPEGAELLDPLQTAFADILAGREDTRTTLDGTAKLYKDTVVPDYAKR
ncbi:hypothetical protein ACFQ0O_06820 [Saccharopolyspora spinosporotrichia]